jgi:peptidylprolyl isomerase
MSRQSVEKWFLLVVVTTSCLAAAAPPTARVPEVVARIGEMSVTGEELRGWVETLAPQDRAALAKDPALLSQAVRAYLVRQLVFQEAVARGWEQRPEVKAALARARAQALTELYLQSVSKAPEGYPGAVELQAAYERNPGAFEAPRQLRLAQVFVAAPKGAGAAAEQLAQKKLAEVQAKLQPKGADFSAVARAESDETNAAERAGELGWLTDAQLVPGIRLAVTGLAVGAVSSPVRLDDGWHMVKVLEVKPPSTRPFAEVKEALAAQLRSERAQATRQAYLTRLLEQNQPTINELELSRLVEP